MAAPFSLPFVLLFLSFLFPGLFSSLAFPSPCRAPFFRGTGVICVLLSPFSFVKIALRWASWAHYSDFKCSAEAHQHCATVFSPRNFFLLLTISLYQATTSAIAVFSGIKFCPCLFAWFWFVKVEEALELHSIRVDYLFWSKGFCDAVPYWTDLGFRLRKQGVKKVFKRRCWFFFWVLGFRSPSLLSCGDAHWAIFISSFGFVRWSPGCLPFTRHFFISIPICSILMARPSVGIRLMCCLFGLVCWCYSVFYSFPTIAGGDSFVAMVNHSMVSDIRNSGCLPFSRGFWWLVHLFLVNLACDYMVWLEKRGLCFTFWCVFSRSALPVSIHVIITWASDTSFDLRAIRTFVFVNAIVVLAYTLGMRICFELLTMGVRYMVVDLLPLITRLEFVFLKDHVFTTLSGLSPLLWWHLRFCFTSGKSCGLRVSRVYFFLVVFIICLLVLCFYFFEFGWSNSSTL